MKKLPISLSILTWKAPLTLENTLKALGPIRFLFSEEIVVCQETDPDEVSLAREYGFRAISLPNNLGIQNGLKIAAESCRNQYFLLLENDCLFNCPVEIAIRTIKTLYNFLIEERIDYASLQALEAETGKRFKRYWKVKNKKMKRTLVGFLRKKNANSVASMLINRPEFEEISQPYLQKISNHLFLTDSQYRRWSNRAVFTGKKFFLSKLIAQVEARPTSRLRNGFPGLEHPINSYWRRSWWQDQCFRIGIARPGLFSHIRCDRPPEID